MPSEEGEPVDGYVLSSERLPEHWGMLGEFEGSGYQRVPVTVELQSGEKLTAYVYALEKSND